MRKLNNKIKRKLRNRKKLKGVNLNRYRISVTKSLRNIFVQIIDDKLNKTLVSASSIEKELKNIHREANIFGEYYHKDAKKDLIASLKTLIQSYE